MRCAKCSSTMTEATLGPVRIDVCDSCGGIWFDAGELRALLALSDTDVKTSMPPSTWKKRVLAMDTQNGACPRCLKLLARVDSMAMEGLHHDRCEACGGAWLDGGELKALCDEPTARVILTFFADPAPAGGDATGLA